MAIRAPYLNRFQYRTGNVVGTRPAAAYGTSITPLNNSYSTYASILAGGSIAQDCYLCVVHANSVASSAAVRDTLLTLGKDDSGGTSYVDWIPDLLVSAAHSYTTSAGGIWYTFPLFVPAGAQIAAKASQNNATPVAIRVAIWLFGLPTAPEQIRWGSYVDAFGIVAASSRGTTVTPGTTSEGAWTSLGTETREHWWWQLGMGLADTNVNSAVIHGDLSLDNGSRIIFEDVGWHTSSTEEVSLRDSLILPNSYYRSNGGQAVHGRLQSSAATDTVSLAAYGVGG
jgi:hypothetical protein